MDLSSSEYSFLKELGVREVPELHKLIDHIIATHPPSPITVEEYEPSDALTYLVTHFHQHYLKWWNAENSQQAFLPCYRSTKALRPNSETNGSAVFLAEPSGVFAGLFFHRW